MTHSAKLTETHRLGLFLVPSSLSWLEIVPLDLEPVRRWEEMGGVSFREGRGGGERFDFDGSLLQQQLFPQSWKVLLFCFFSSSYQRRLPPLHKTSLCCQTKCSKKNSWQKTFRRWERWFIMQLTHQCTQTNKEKKNRKQTDQTYGDFTHGSVSAVIKSDCQTSQLILELHANWQSEEGSKATELLNFDFCCIVTCTFYLTCKIPILIFTCIWIYEKFSITSNNLVIFSLSFASGSWLLLICHFATLVQFWLHLEDKAGTKPLYTCSSFAAITMNVLYIASCTWHSSA